MAVSPVSTKINYLISSLERLHGRQVRYSTKPPMDQLIATILSQRTTYADERTAYQKLLSTFGDWEGVAKADVKDIENCIKTSRWPEVKAPRIKEIINHILDTYGETNLDFLAEMETAEAQQLLMDLPGVGFKSATFVLLFSLRKPVIPVDTHVHRVSTRFGILPPKITQAKSHTELLKLLPNTADDLLNYHKLLFKHGQRVCTYSKPKCEECTVSDQCDYNLSRTSISAKPK